MIPTISPESVTRLLAENRAGADALPGPVKTAFGQMAITVDCYIVRPVVAYDFALFKQLNSPIHRQILEIFQNPDKPGQVDSTEQEQWDLIWQLTRPCLDVDKVFQVGGAKSISEAARVEIGMQLNLGLVSKLLAASMEQVKRHMDTMVKYGAEENGKTFFREAGASQTASAGG